MALQLRIISKYLPNIEARSTLDLEFYKATSKNKLFPPIDLNFDDELQVTNYQSWRIFIVAK